VIAVEDSDIEYLPTMADNVEDALSVGGYFDSNDE
jgi:hypothetical protein